MENFTAQELFDRALKRDFYDTPKHRSEFSTLILRSARMGHKVAQLAAGLGNEAFKNCFDQHSELIKYEFDASDLKSLANDGDADAQWLLAHCYFYGCGGLPEDKTQSLEWYHKSALQGHADSQRSVGYMYHDGEGCVKDMTEALKWYRMAAEQDNPMAQCSVGMIYETGVGIVEVDLMEAMRWYLLAATGNDADAQFRLAIIYARGQAVPRDALEALKWIQLAAEQGHPGALFDVGAYHYRGLAGLHPDPKEAVRWFRLAAESENDLAQCFLGLMLCDPKQMQILDREEGSHWLWETSFIKAHDLTKADIEYLIMNANKFSHFSTDGKQPTNVYKSGITLNQLASTAYWNEGIQSLQVLSGRTVLMNDIDTSEFPDSVLELLDDIREVMELGGVEITDKDEKHV